ncbi:MAG: hypothetical protein M1488_08700 [Gammaproteobacteria bacterium]|nr:hypothetical protein [Gammaproteobacteria bacterium]
MKSSAVRVGHGRRFGVVPDYILESSALSLDTRAVAAWLAGRSDGFEIRVEAMRRILGLSEAKWGRVKKELEKEGWWRSLCRRDQQGRIVWQNHFQDFPPSTIPQISMDGETMDGGAIHGGKGDIPKGNYQKEITKKTTTTRRGAPERRSGGSCSSEDVARAQTLIAKLRPEVEKHRAGNALRSVTEHDWQLAAKAMAQVPLDHAPAVAAHWTAALRRTGTREVRDPVAFLTTLVQRAKDGTLRTTPASKAPPPPPPPPPQAKTYALDAMAEAFAEARSALGLPPTADRKIGDRV